jgi:hypothetical protein
MRAAQQLWLQHAPGSGNEQAAPGACTSGRPGRCRCGRSSRSPSPRRRRRSSTGRSSCRVCRRPCSRRRPPGRAGRPGRPPAGRPAAGAGSHRRPGISRGRRSARRPWDRPPGEGPPSRSDRNPLGRERVGPAAYAALRRCQPQQRRAEATDRTAQDRLLANRQNALLADKKHCPPTSTKPDPSTERPMRRCARMSPHDACNPRGASHSERGRDRGPRGPASSARAPGTPRA